MWSTWKDSPNSSQKAIYLNVIAKITPLKSHKLPSVTKNLSALCILLTRWGVRYSFVYFWGARLRLLTWLNKTGIMITQRNTKDFCSLTWVVFANVNVGIPRVIYISYKPSNNREESLIYLGCLKIAYWSKLNIDLKSLPKLHI